MSFDINTKIAAYKRANGRCERCRRLCRVVTTEYGGVSFPDSEFHHITSVQAGGHDGLSNCEHLCIDCHKNTKSYGRQ